MKELLENFGVNWKLLLAQVVNFGILFYVLKRFAYGPIVNMLEERQKRIKKGLQEAAESEQKLREAEEKERLILEKANLKALTLVSEAADVAHKKEAEIIETGYHKAESIIKGAERKIEEEKLTMQDEIHKNAGSLVQSAVAKVLGKMEVGERDKVLIEEALSELKNIAKNSHAL